MDQRHTMEGTGKREREHAWPHPLVKMAVRTGIVHTVFIVELP